MACDATDPAAAGPPDPAARDDLIRFVYGELRGIAESLLRDERRNHTLQPTALVHEAWLRLAKDTNLPFAGEGGRRKFVAFAANVMRQLLVDHARGHGAGKRGRGWRRIDLGVDLPVAEVEPGVLLDVHQALEELANKHERVARTAELRLFGGLSLAEIADIHGISKTATQGDWALARAVLSKAISA